MVVIPVHNLLIDLWFLLSAVAYQNKRKLGICFQNSFDLCQFVPRVSRGQQLAICNAIILNRRVLSHIIGIERWGQRRLSVGLGEPCIEEEYNDYRPARETSWSDPKQLFVKTRANTLELRKTIENSRVDTAQTVRHNQQGDFTLRDWMRYLESHASIEAKKIR